MPPAATAFYFSLPGNISVLIVLAAWQYYGSRATAIVFDPLTRVLGALVAVHCENGGAIEVLRAELGGRRDAISRSPTIWRRNLVGAWFGAIFTGSLPSMGIFATTSKRFSSTWTANSGRSNGVVPGRSPPTVPRSPTSLPTMRTRNGGFRVVGVRSYWLARGKPWPRPSPLFTRYCVSVLAIRSCLPKTWPLN